MAKIIGSAALAPGGDSGTDLTQKGDLHGYSSENTRIPISTNNFSLLADSAQALGLKWAASPTSVLTTQSDLLYASSANTLARLAKGTASQVLAMNSGATAPEWVTLSGGAWSQIASSALSGAAASLTVTGMTKKKFLDINITGGFASDDIPSIQIGDGSIDTSNYAWNVTQNGSNSTSGTGSNIQCTNAQTGSNFYIHAYMFNNDSDLNSFVGQTTSGNVNWTWTGYWNDSDQIDELKVYGSAIGNDLSTCQIVIYGAD